MKTALFSGFTQISSLLIFFFSRPALAFAQNVDPCPKDIKFKALCDPDLLNFGTLVGNLITIAFILAIVIALVFLVYGGIKWIISGGDKAAIESARNTLVAAIIGLVIVFLSYFILNIILSLFDISLSGGFNLPKLTQ